SNLVEEIQKFECTGCRYTLAINEFNNYKNSNKPFSTCNNCRNTHK
ncbi:21325_t:CDS:1, partial [Racocetra persica]